MKKIKIVALFGKSGAGKDTILKEIVSMSQFKDKVKEIISCTTRPIRENEKNGVNYHFVTEKEFSFLDMIESTCFRGWLYGTPLSELDEDKINIGIFNINGIKNMLTNNNLLVVPIYIQAEDKIRLIRILDREKNPDCLEICRRFQTDDKDFKNITFPYLICENNKNFYYDYQVFNDIILNGQIPKFNTK